MWGESSDIERESQRHSSTAQIPGKVFVLPDLPLWPCRTFKVILRTLNRILYLTGSCWRTVEVSVIRCFTGADQQLSRNTLVIKADKKGSFKTWRSKSLNLRHNVSLVGKKQSLYMLVRSQPANVEASKLGRNFWTKTQFWVSREMVDYSTVYSLFSFKLLKKHDLFLSLQGDWHVLNILSLSQSLTEEDEVSVITKWGEKCENNHKSGVMKQN